MKKPNPQIIRRFNAFQKLTHGKCPIIPYFEPIAPAVKCLIEHRLASGIAYWVVYKGQPIGDSFVAYVYRKKKTGKGPGGMPYNPVPDWDELRPDGVPWPLDRPGQYINDLPPESIDLINQTGLFFYSFLVFDASAGNDSNAYLTQFGNNWIPGLLTEIDQSVYPHLKTLHAQKPIQDRDEAYAKAWEYMLKNFKTESLYGLSGSSVAWYQGAAITKQKRWDHELAVGNFQVQAAFLRGVSRQHQIPFVIYAAPWGYSPDGVWGMKADPETPFAKVLNVPKYGIRAAGKPDHLLERQWYFCWFSGPAALVLESMQLRLFKKGKDPQTFEPTRIAGVVKKLNELAYASDFDRGAPYRPACILMDERHGWAFPHHPDAFFDRPLMQRRKIWGIFDYTDEDVMVDNFFGTVYPGYERAGGFGCEEGDLTATPYGESFDVLMSNANARALAQYPVTFMVGRPKLTPAFKNRLERYVSGGGRLVVNASQVDFEWGKFLGVKWSPKHHFDYTALGTLRPSDYSEWITPRLRWPEHRYRYTRLAPAGADVLAVTPHGDPLVLRHKVGRGSVYLVTAHFMQELDGQHRPNGLLKVARHLIGDLLAPHQRVLVRGPELQYLVNRTKAGLAVMLLNNRKEIWNGWLAFPGLAGAAVREWYAEEALHTHAAGRDLSIRLTIPPQSLRLITLQRKPRS